MDVGLMSAAFAWRHSMLSDVIAVVRGENYIRVVEDAVFLQLHDQYFDHLVDCLKRL